MEYKTQKASSLLDALREHLVDSSNRTIRNLLKNKSVLVNGKLVQKSSYTVSEGDVLKILPKQKSTYQNVKIIFESKDYIIVDKPANLLSVPLDNKGGENVFQILKDTYPKTALYPVHRLDKEASGLLIFVKGKENQIIFKELFAEHLITRQYLAICEGKLPHNSGVFTSKLKELPNYNVVSAEDGKDATTFYKVVCKRKNTSCLQLQLETGRKHQIRVHLSESGNPIVGDKRYGAKSSFHKRIALHAYRLAFTDPSTKKEMSFYSQIPEEFSLENFLNEYSSNKMEDIHGQKGAD
ncbi:MAG: RNA pseudouridine synthase [Chlamydiae bacterium CG10_big_fil_rev_8_21_14_0_10_35_9]|nr:MAG: RNA pseudouridine synthase [Chlamydiae bacterium CG10_big_fil_rev_8_21_14_0_10_35_9]